MRVILPVHADSWNRIILSWSVLIVILQECHPLSGVPSLDLRKINLDLHEDLEYRGLKWLPQQLLMRVIHVVAFGQRKVCRD